MNPSFGRNYLYKGLLLASLYEDERIIQKLYDKYKINESFT